MAKQNKYPEVYLGDPEIDFVMLAKSQGVNGAKVTSPHELERASQRGVEATTGGEPYVSIARRTRRAGAIRPAPEVQAAARRPLSPPPHRVFPPP